MDGSVWYVISRKNENGMYAYAHPIGRYINLASFVKDFPDIETMNACNTKKMAKMIAQTWNEQYKANGTYMFADGPKF